MEPVKIIVSSSPSHIAVVRSAAESFGEHHGFSHEQAGKIGLAVNEALANVIRHGYQGDIHQQIEISMGMIDEGDKKGMKIIIRDHGLQVDPDCIKGRNLEKVRPGGLGVHIIKTVMDEVSYRCQPEGGMELTMIKFLVKSTRESTI
jgi:anti-sigma regulatory factor (Ser/Thr protein kinase)